MTDAPSLADCLQQFREARRALEKAVRTGGLAELAPLPDGAWCTGTIVAHIAAWLQEAGERIPALLAGSPARVCEPDVFNAQAVARMQGWTSEQVFGLYKRAADRYETIVADLRESDIEDEPDVWEWLTNMPAHVREHLAELGAGPGKTPPRAVGPAPPLQGEGLHG